MGKWDIILNMNKNIIPHRNGEYTHSASINKALNSATPHAGQSHLKELCNSQEKSKIKSNKMSK